MKKLITWLIAITLTSVSAFADIKLGTGSQAGNYYKMAKDINSYCGSSVDERIQILPSEGSIDNLNGMSNKKFSMAIVQADALMSQAKTAPSTVNLNLIKIVAPLHVETVHLLVPVNYQPKTAEGSLWDKYVANAKPKPVKLSSLKGETVSSWGGSVVSAKALSYFFGLKWNIRTITEQQAASADTPILLVGGQPYAPVEKLLATGKWRLLPIDYNSIASVAPFYKKVSASYKVQGKIQNIPTVGVQAILVGKSFRNAKKNTNSIKLAECINQNLADLADDSDTNPNWGSAYEESRKNQLMQWSYFNK